MSTERKAIKVTLRKKSISGNRESLYLDFYPAIKGEDRKSTRREFLGLYLYNTTNYEKLTDRQINKLDALTQLQINLEREKNLETLNTAQQIRNTRENELNPSEKFSKSHERFEQMLEKEEAEQAKRKLLEKEEERRLSIDFIKYFKSMAHKRKGSNSDNWISCLHYLEAFTGGTLPVRQLNERFCSDFKEYLLKAPSRKSAKTTLSQNSAVSYFNKLKASLKQAYKDGVINEPLNNKIDIIPTLETSREFLSMEELKRLASTQFEDDLLRRVCLFSALTGLRFIDIKNLKWSNVYLDENEGAYIRFTQQKTKLVEDNHPISNQAYHLLGERTKDEQPVFKGLKYSKVVYLLPKWLEKAGINKSLGFHGFRHTFATLQLVNGTDIYTVSKMLGHRDLKTTQVYAKIVDETKRKASNAILLDL